MINIRPIQPEDNRSTASVIRSVMTSFGCVGDGYSINDPEVDEMYDAYQGQRAIYYVVCKQDKVIGGAGIAPLAGGEEQVCELKKMYFLEEARGLGIGQQVLDLLIKDAKSMHYKTIYLETTTQMKAANKFYQKNHFLPLNCQMGNTGHGGCDLYYKLEL